MGMDSWIWLHVITCYCQVFKKPMIRLRWDVHPRKNPMIRSCNWMQLARGPICCDRNKHVRYKTYNHILTP